MKPKDPYAKHIYWLARSEEAHMREELAARDIKVKSAKGIVCTPLDPTNKISSVSPDIWDETCGRQGSWYRTSERNGQYLVVSSFELEGYRSRKAAVITESDFVPPRLATLEDKEALLEDPLLKERLPDRWQRVSEREKRIYLKWAKRFGSKTNDFDFLYLTHTSNHANFISPSLFVEDDEGIIPYSIDRSAHLCSCCVELFQILGHHYKRKLVAPCAGAVVFARLKADRYLLVQKPPRNLLQGRKNTKPS